MKDSNNLLYSLDELKEIASNFTNELKLASQGEKNSLAFLKNPLPENSLVKEGELFQSMAIGGSNLEKALMKVENGKIVMVDYYSEPLELLKTKELLLDLVLRHFDKSVNVLNLNFAYPSEPTLRNGYLDGKFLYGTKEHDLTGLSGLFIGEEIEKYINEKLNKEIKVSSANDTVCLVLAGLNLDNRRNLIGGIVGTGMNFSLFLDDKTIINLESGNFNKFPQTITGKRIDEESHTQGRQFFEKEIAGGYLYQHFNLMCEMEGLTFDPITSTIELDDIANSPDHEQAHIAISLIERSASLTASQIVGIYNFLGQEKISAIIEGSVFWKGYKYKEFVASYLNQLELDDDQVSFHKVEKSSLYGASGLAI